MWKNEYQQKAADLHLKFDLPSHTVFQQPVSAQQLIVFSEHKRKDDVTDMI